MIPSAATCIHSSRTIWHGSATSARTPSSATETRSSCSCSLPRRASQDPWLICSMDQLEVDLVLVFLDHLEHGRKNSAATRNARLAALHTFFRYVGGQDPLLLDQCRRIVGIPLKRVPTPVVGYLEQEELEAVLHAIDRSTPGGRRDFTLLSLAYQTGARVQELLSLRACDLQLTPPAWVRLLGKGRKERVIPLWNQTAGSVTRVVGRSALLRRTAVHTSSQTSAASRLRGGASATYSRSTFAAQQRAVRASLGNGSILTCSVIPPPSTCSRRATDPQHP